MAVPCPESARGFGGSEPALGVLEQFRELEHAVFMADLGGGHQCARELAIFSVQIDLADVLWSSISSRSSRSSRHFGDDLADDVARGVAERRGLVAIMAGQAEHRHVPGLIGFCDGIGEQGVVPAARRRRSGSSALLARNVSRDAGEERHHDRRLGRL